MTHQLDAWLCALRWCVCCAGRAFVIDAVMMMALALFCSVSWVLKSWRGGIWCDPIPTRGKADSRADRGNLWSGGFWPLNGQKSQRELSLGNQDSSGGSDRSGTGQRFVSCSHDKASGDGVKWASG